MGLSKKCAVVFVTAENIKAARKIAQGVIRERLVACVNIVPKIESVYWWQDKIENSPESMLIMKTKVSLKRKLIDRIKKLHSYTVPEIIFLPIMAGNKDYLKWVGAETK
ncbi:MAG: divalent-cation tolerance protein CutA [Elusimicrobia bacterium]|nr:divalent-cation tolerance protein CutA [Elusimicrobiota bacterium]